MIWVTVRAAGEENPLMWAFDTRESYTEFNMCKHKDEWERRSVYFKPREEGELSFGELVSTEVMVPATPLGWRLL